MTREESVADIAALRARIEAARGASRGRGGGVLLALVDEIVLDLGRRSGWASRGAALAALGGYGRGELSPRSDLDLLFLHRKGSSPPPVEPVLYPLWDLGFDVGHALRTPGDCGRLAAEELSAATALLDSRLLLGEGALLEEARRRAGIRPGGSRRMRGWLALLTRDVEERRARYGEISHLLEPHLKEGRGGLRDYQASRWLLACVGAGEETVSALTGGRAVEAYEFLLEARSALHRAARRKTDHLTFDFHRDVAEECLPRGGLEEFFGRLHEASRRIATAWAEVSALGGGRPRRWSLGRDSGRPPDPGRLVRELPAWAEEGGPLPLRLRRALSEGPPEGVAAAVCAAAATILRARASLAPLLTELHELGLLGLVLPEVERVIHQVHYDASHAFTTGVHCLETLRTFEGLWLGRLEKEETHLTRLAVGILRPWTARLAALCHDLGKVEGRSDHARTGAAITRSVALRLGFPPDDAEEAAALVAAHETLPAIAFGRDLEDPTAWEDARRAGGAALDALVVLAFADLRTTHPGTSGRWSGWRRDLLLTLAARAAARGEETTQAPRERVRAALTEGAVPGSAERFEAVWAKIPPRQASQTPPDLLARLLRLWSELGNAPARWNVEPRGEGLTEVLGVAHAAPRLLSSTLGVLTALRFDILSVQVHAWPDGTVHLWLRAAPASAEHPSPREVARRLTAGIVGESAEPPASGSGLPNPRADATPVEVRVRLLADGGPFHTPLQVRCRDRKGLLRDLANCFESLGLRVVYALVTTVGPMAQDVFHLQDLFGSRIQGPEKLRVLLERVEAVARGEPPAPLIVRPPKQAEKDGS